MPKLDTSSQYLIDTTGHEKRAAPVLHELLLVPLPRIVYQVGHRIGHLVIRGISPQLVV